MINKNLENLANPEILSLNAFRAVELLLEFHRDQFVEFASATCFIFD